MRSLNFAGLLGGGVLHTKLWLVDRTHVYVGSANMDWRALTQVKELGLVAMNCSCLANDVAKIFEVYWQLGKDGRIPPSWPDAFGTKINVDNPINFTVDSNKYRSFVAVNLRRIVESSKRIQINGIKFCNFSCPEFATASVSIGQNERSRCNFALYRESWKIHLHIGYGLFSIDNLLGKGQVLARHRQRSEVGGDRS